MAPFYILRKLLMNKHFMLDLETMGLRPTSAILSIGIVHFDQSRIIDKFYTPVSLASCLAYGLTTDKSTEDWWAKQSDVARRAWDTPDAPPLEVAMSSMAAWMRQWSTNKNICPWGNGSDFDNVLLANACRALDVETPWPYYNSHCFRTMKNMFPVEPSARVGTYHNALDDAITQVNWLHRILDVHNIQLP